MKQAYSLWRSWFEQSLFALYFLEAPINRRAWKVSEAVKLEDNPKYRLMLHQLLTESGEPHPFTLVYGERHTNLLQAFAIASSPKADRPVPRAVRILTLLSQGVHGTYQPTRAQSSETCLMQVEEHCLPALQKAFSSLSHFWVLLLTDLAALPPGFLIAMRNGNVDLTDPSVRDLGIPEAILKLGPILQHVFPVN